MEKKSLSAKTSQISETTGIDDCSVQQTGATFNVGNNMCP
tara:strand:- start:111856 stop:111975 length:120 start_codon:yes stop_codon:yes gene_type:complete